MTDVTLLFDVETRAIKDQHKRYSGQVNDSLSTTLHFEYNPPTFLDDGAYMPYITFNVKGEDGNPITYHFDGYTFEIPWDVTSRVNGQRVEFQLFFVRNTLSFNEGVVHLESTEYLQSAIYGIAIKSSIIGGNSSCPPMTPETEPSVVGYINLWKDYGVIVPVEQIDDEENHRLILRFHTYNGTHDCDVVLNVPYLVDGKIPHEFLDIITEIAPGELVQETYKLPTAKAVIDWVSSEFTDKSMGIPVWEADRTYQKNSTVMFEENIYISIADDNVGHQPVTDPTQEDMYWSTVSEYDLIINQWSATPRTDKVPSEALVTSALATKLDDTQVIGDWGLLNPSEVQIPSAVLTKQSLDDKLDDSQLITVWHGLLSDISIPSEKLVKTSLDSKLDDSQLVTTWDGLSDSNIPSQKLVKDSLDAKLDDSQLVADWNGLSDSKIPSQKLVKDSLDSLDAEHTATEGAIRQEMADAVQGLTEDISEVDSKIDATATEINARIDSEVSELDDKIDATALTIDTRITNEVATINAKDAQQDSSIASVQAQLANKTDILHAIPTWSATKVYEYESTVILGTKLFVSLSDGNLGNDPYDDTEGVWWSEISGGGGGGGNVNGKVIAFGNNIDTEYILSHNLGTYNLIFSIMRNDATREFVQARVQAYSYSQAKVILTSPPGTNGLVFSVIGTRGTSPSSDVEVIDITEPSEEWTYPNDSGRPVFVQTFDGTGDQIFGAISEPSTTGFDPVVTGFASPQSGYMLIAKSEYTYEFENQTTWIIPHQQGSLMAVQCYNDEQGQIYGDIQQDDGNVVVITWNEPNTGYAVLVKPKMVVEFVEQSEWTVEHNLGQYVAVQTFDEQGDQMQGNIQQDGNTVTVTFGSAKSGYMLIVANRAYRHPADSVGSNPLISKIL